MKFSMLNLYIEILLRLPLREADANFPQLEHFDLRQGKILHKPGEHLEFAHFINGGLISIMTAFPTGKSVGLGRQ